MKLRNELEPIRDWAENKGIYKKGDLKTQFLKLQEESGELAKAILNDDEEEVIDAIGDCVVVLTSIAELAKMKYRNECKTCLGKGVYFNKQYVTKCNDCRSGELGPLTIENCINTAYNVISKRKGKMINGTFVKDK